MPDGRIMIVSSVSDFCDAMSYCELKIEHFLKGMEQPQTEITINGTEAHNREVEYEREHIEFNPITQEELADDNRIHKFS